MDAVNFNFNKSLDDTKFLKVGINSKLSKHTFDLKTSFNVIESEHNLTMSLNFVDFTNNFASLLENIEREVKYKYSEYNWNVAAQATFRPNGTEAVTLAATYQENDKSVTLKGKWDDFDISGSIGFNQLCSEDFNIGFFIGSEKFGASTEYKLLFNTLRGDFEVDRRGKKQLGFTWSIDF